MPEYRFSYQRGRVRATYGITAANDSHAFKKMQLFVKQHMVKYINKSMQLFGEDNRWHFLSGAKAATARLPPTLQAAE